MYKSPIEILEDIQTTVSTQYEEWIVNAVISCGINVDKERLLHALAYDQFAYESGYSDGKRDAMKELVRCGECKHRDEITGWCEDVQDYISNTNWFCAGGERKGGDER